MSTLGHEKIRQHSSSPPRCLLSQFTLQDGQFHYHLWIPSSGLISATTVKSVKNSMFKDLGSPMSIYKFSIYILFSLQLILSKLIGSFYMYYNYNNQQKAAPCLVNDEFSVPVTNNLFKY